MEHNHPLVERIFVWLERVLADRRNPAGFIQKAFVRFRKTLQISTILYLILLVPLLAAMTWIGEKNWFLSLLIYCPASIWLSPLLILTPLCLIFSRPLCWLHLPPLLLVFLVFAPFHWSLSSTTKKTTLKVISNNIGEREINTLQKFIEAEKPDIIALQDSYGFYRTQKKDPALFSIQRGEFLLISRFPIKSSGLVDKLDDRRTPVAAWFELDYQGRTIIVYNVHTPTPRRQFRKLTGSGLLLELFKGGGIYSHDNRNAYKDDIKKRVELMRSFADLLKQEKRPFLAVGDFNAPSQGYIHDFFAGSFQDAFAKTGCGHGYTFPGDIENWFSLLGPWLRIDYIFAGETWKPISCRVEPSQNAQHHAVVATLEMLDSPQK